MGTRTYVSSVVYNLAGDINNRPDYLKTTVVGAVIGEKDSIPETTASAYMQGPGMRLKSFARWARTQGYTNQVGLNGGTLSSGHAVDETVLAGQIPHDPAVDIQLESAIIDEADYTHWADQYVAANRPADWGTEYLSSINDTTNIISIAFVDGSTESFTPLDYDPFGSYLYAVYSLSYMDGDVKCWGNPQVFIYKKGGGNPTLDAMWDLPGFFGLFFPFIPYRLDNKSVAELYPDTIYPACKKAMHRAFNADYDDIKKKLDESESIKDIDYAYVTFGACLNTKENASKKYIYKFFEKLLQDPSQPKSISVASSSNTVMNYNMIISWNSIVEETGNGSYKPGAKTGELEITNSLGATPEGGLFEDIFGAIAVTTIIWQVDANKWKRLLITGLKHKNLVYRGNAVTIWANDALADAEESGFIIPLHENIYRAMSIKDFTQMATACCYIVFNCYKIVKTHWWQSWWFQIIIVVGVVVVAVLTGGIGAASAGLLGTNGAVGAALGFAVGSTLAIMVGAIVNALAAMVLVMLITKVSTLAFGKLGTIIGAIASVVTLQVATGMVNGKSFAAAFHDLLSARNLITLSSAVGNGIAGYFNAAVQDIMEEINKYQQQNNAELKTIEDKRLEEFGYGQGIIDPIQLTDFTEASGSTTGFNSLVEPVELFLSRTLMTGSDIAEMSIEMLHKFADLTLNTNLLLAE